MSPNDFRNISYPEPKISTSFLNCGQMDTQIDVPMDLSISRAIVPTLGHLKKVVL